MESPPIKRALISVSEKTGLIDFGRGLTAAGVQIYASGGTRRHLQESGVEVHEVSAYTRFPEMMDGRIKTLHPAVHAGILCRHNRPEDVAALAEHQFVPFELVVVNLYPFEATVARDGVTMAEAIEQVDIGGPTLIRAAAKNHAFVTVVTHPEQYADVLEAVTNSGETTPEQRRDLAAAAFVGTAEYEQAIAQFFLQQTSGDLFPSAAGLCLHRKTTLRYGENPHQKAALYTLPSDRGTSLLAARQLHGKELSYNNLLDLDSALALVRSLPQPATVVLKHNNPCGAAIADTLETATRRAWEGDPVSAFGSVLGMNQPVDAATAEVLAEPGRFVEAIVAPQFEPEAIDILTTKPKWKANVRLLATGALDDAAAVLQWRQIGGGFLAQEADRDADPEDEWKVVTRQQPTDSQWSELRFAWAVCRHVRSNAIVLTNGQALVGVGAGQMSRVDSVEIAIGKAGPRSQGSVLASDAFFPFDDSIHRAADAGVAAVIQPGGSRRDADVIAACDARGLTMVFTGRRHFKH
jgi:phosphoribosylaminoimidazolecarboxamide formyltransferase/IMP cyclohydrolase